MLDDALLKYKQGMTTSKEVIRVFGEDARVRIEQGDF